MVWTREATEAFIEEWIKLPCLYDSKHQLYYSKHSRKIALEKICAAVQIHRPQTTPADCKAKLNGLRTQFAAEQHKVNRKSGPLTGEVYISSWWPFKRLTFLADHIQTRKAILMGHNGIENQASPSSVGELYSNVTIKREAENSIGAEDVGQPSSCSSSIYVPSPMPSPQNSDCVRASSPPINCEITAPPSDSHTVNDTTPRISLQSEERVVYKDGLVPDASSPRRATSGVYNSPQEQDTGGEALAQFLAFSWSQIKSHEIKMNLKHVWLRALMDAEVKDLSYNSPQ